MNGPKHIQIDRKNRVLIADAENHQILRYDPITERVERLAGVGKAGIGGLDGSPTEAMLNRPHGVFELPDRDIIITDSYNNRILKILKAKD
jgi:streptogramin lyase